MNIRPLIPCYSTVINRGISYGSKDTEKKSSKIIDLSSPESWKDYDWEGLMRSLDSQEVKDELDKVVPKGEKEPFIKSLKKTINSLRSLKNLPEIVKNSANKEEAFNRLVDTLPDYSDDEKKKIKETFSKLSNSPSRTSNYLKEHKSGIISAGGKIAFLIAAYSFFSDIYSHADSYPPTHGYAGIVALGATVGTVIGIVVVLDKVSEYAERKRTLKDSDRILEEGRKKNK